MYGITEETVSKEDFERYRLNSDARNEQMQMILTFDGVKEVFIFSECQRLEYYLYVDENSFSHGEFLRYLAEYTSKPLDEIILETSSKFNEDVVRHLFELMGGFLDYTTNEFLLYYSLRRLFELHQFSTQHQMLKELFESALEFASTSRFKKELQPLIHDIIPRIFVTLKECINSFRDLTFVVIGDWNQLLEVKTLLKNYTNASITLAPTDIYSEKLLEQLDPLETNVRAVDVDDSAYYLSEADIIVVLSEMVNHLKNYQLDQLLAIRQTPKKQYIVDEFDTMLGNLLQERSGAKKITIRSDDDYSFEEKEEARHFLDELLDVATEKIATRYLNE